MFHLSWTPPLQILRGLKRLVLGLGQLPSPPQQLECAAVNKSAVRLSWQAPAAAGHPLYHKYLLQRQLLDPGAAGRGRGARTRCAAVGLPEGGGGGGGGAPDNAGSWRGTPSCPAEPWETVADPDDELSAWLDAPPAAGSYRYRLAAWSAFGRSAFAYTPVACAVTAAQRPRLPPAQALPPSDMQALLASLSAGSNLSARQGGAAGSGKAWSWSAASSAVVVALTILLKASQLQVAARLAALWRLAAGTLGRRGQLAGEAGVQTEPQRAGSAANLAAGMQRVGSSLASLASLGGEAGTAVDEQQQQQGLGQADASGSLLYSLSSSQLLSLASSQGLALDPSADLAGAAASGLAADGALNDAAAEQLALAIKRGQHCGHPGCHRRFDRLRDVRRRLEVRQFQQCQLRSQAPWPAKWLVGSLADCRCCCRLALLPPAPLLLLLFVLLPTWQPAVLFLPGCVSHACIAAPAPSLPPSLPPALPTPLSQSHYCGLCQRVFCLQHTRASPHGPRGACGLESSCLCYACFAELAPAQQAAYERVNRLPSACAANGTHGGPVGEAAASAGGAALADASGVEEQHPTAGIGSSDGPLNEQDVPVAAVAASAQARRRWRKAGGLLRALARFKAAIADRQPSNVQPDL